MCAFATKYSEWQSNAANAVRFSLHWNIYVYKTTAIHFPEPKICYSIWTRYQVFAPVFIEYLINATEEREKKEKKSASRQKGKCRQLFLQILSVKHQFYLLFASIFFLFQAAETRQKKWKEKLLANSNRVVAYTYIRIALCL